MDPVAAKLASELSAHAVATFAGLLKPHCNVPMKQIRSFVRILHTIVHGFLIHRILANPGLPDFDLPISTPALKEWVREMTLSQVKLLKVVS